MKIEEQKLNENSIMLVGKTGTGKSSLGNILLKQHPIDGSFKTSCSTQACTDSATFLKTNQFWDSSFNGLNLRVIDLPGLLDCHSQDKWKSRIQGITNLLQKDFLSVKYFICLINGQELRFDEAQKESLSMLKTMFGEKIMDHILFMVSHWPRDPYSVKVRELQQISEEKFADQLKESLVKNQLMNTDQSSKVQILFYDALDFYSESIEIDKPYYNLKINTIEIFKLYQTIFDNTTSNFQISKDFKVQFINPDYIRIREDTNNKALIIIQKLAKYPEYMILMQKAITQNLKLDAYWKQITDQEVNILVSDMNIALNAILKLRELYTQQKIEILSFERELLQKALFTQQVHTLIAKPMDDSEKHINLEKKTIINYVGDVPLNFQWKDNFSIYDKKD